MKPQLHDKTLIKLSGLPAVPANFFRRQAELRAEWNAANAQCKGDFDTLRARFPMIDYIDLHRDQGQLYAQVVVADLKADFSAIPKTIQNFPVKIVDLSTRVPPRTAIQSGPG